MAQIQDQHVSAVLQVPGDLRQLVVAEVLKEEDRTFSMIYMSTSLFLGMWWKGGE